MRCRYQPNSPKYLKPFPAASTSIFQIEQYKIDRENIMPKKLEGKIAIVPGGSAGIGLGASQ
jgi:hypothetical protein